MLIFFYCYFGVKKLKFVMEFLRYSLWFFVKDVFRLFFFEELKIFVFNLVDKDIFFIFFDVF